MPVESQRSVVHPISGGAYATVDLDRSRPHLGRHCGGGAHHLDGDNGQPQLFVTAACHQPVCPCVSPSSYRTRRHTVYSGWSASARSRNVAATFAATRPMVLGTWCPGLASKLDSSSMSLTICSAIRLRLGEPWRSACSMAVT